MSDASPGRERLRAIARRVMSERGLLPDFSPAALAQSGALGERVAETGPAIRDRRDLAWVSIDNDDTRDLDQLSVAEPLAAGAVKLTVAVADVDATVAEGSPIDVHARANTTSVYTAAEIFPMLPERLSTDLTSLGEARDRLAVAVEMTVGPDGVVTASDLYRALVRNQAKLAYDSVAAWLAGTAPAPPAVAAKPAIADQLRLQARVAQAMKDLRHHRGALTLETTEARAVFDGDALADLRPDEKNAAKDLIEDFMIAANVATAQFLERHGLPSLRRVLRTPERWDRIVLLAAGLGERLPAEPSASALQVFLARRRAADPARFADLSLAVVKLLGSGEYAVELPGGSSEGHFGLAVRDYTHSTAPNRRFPDLTTQRLVKAAIAGQRLSVHRGAAERPGPPLHAAGGQRHEGGTAGAQVCRGAAARLAHRRALRRDRHRRLAEGDLGAHLPSGGGGAGGARRARPRRGRRGPRRAGAHRRRAGLHRLRPGLTTLKCLPPGKRRGCHGTSREVHSGSVTRERSTDEMKRHGIVGTAALFLLLGTSPGWTEQGKGEQASGDAQEKGNGKGKGKAAKPQDKGQQQKAGPQAKAQQPAPEQKQQQAKGRQADQQQANQQQANQQQANQKQADQQRANQQQASQQANQQRAADQQRADQQRTKQQQAKASQQANQQRADQQRADQQTATSRGLTSNARTSSRRSSSEQTSSEQTSSEQTSRGPTSRGPTSNARTSSRRSSSEQTSRGLTSNARTSSWRSSSEQTSRGLTSSARTSSRRSSNRRTSSRFVSHEIVSNSSSPRSRTAWSSTVNTWTSSCLSRHGTGSSSSSRIDLRAIDSSSST